MQNTPQGGAPSGNGPQQNIYPGGPARRPAWWYWVGGGVVAVVLCCGAFGIGSLASHGGGANSTGSNGSNGSASTPSATNTPKLPTATPKPKQWVTVHEWKGTSNQQTPTFDLPDGSRIVWSYTVTYSANLFSCELDDASDQLPIDLIVNNANTHSDSGEYNVHGDHSAYLNIEADSVKYDVKVQVYQ